MQLRGEAYNALNHENFANPTIGNSGTASSGVSVSVPNTFGEITKTNTSTAARVLQLALRFDF